MRTPFVLLACAAISACASNSGAMKIGPDTYQITATRHNMIGGAAGAQASAMSEADAQCTRLGRELLVTNTSSGFERPHNRFSATFRCLAKTDPTLVRPNLQPVPEVVIEDRRK